MARVTIGLKRFFSLAALTLALAGVACGGDDLAPPTPDASPTDADARTADADAASPPSGDPFPLTWETGEIELVEERDTMQGGTLFRARHYRNRAYRCGRIGYFTFVVLDVATRDGQQAPLWVFIHGGGAGYFDETGTYHPSAGTANDAESMDDLLRKGPVPGRGLTIDRRVAEGYRFLLPAMCDHDFHSGLGTPYPHNPGWDGTDTVDGLLALVASVDFTANGSDSLAGYPTTHVFLQGASSGSAGAYSAAYAFSRSGIQLNGAILDATLITDRQPMVMGYGRLPPEMRDPDFSWAGLAEKVGVMLTDARHYAETQVQAGFPVPLFDAVSANDPFCGGEGLLEVAASAGAATNCDFVHQPLREAMDARPPTEHHRWHRLDSADHVLTARPGAVHDAIDMWLTNILADTPAPPWP